MATNNWPFWNQRSIRRQRVAVRLRKLLHFRPERPDLLRHLCGKVGGFAGVGGDVVECDGFGGGAFARDDEFPVAIAQGARVEAGADGVNRAGLCRLRAPRFGVGTLPLWKTTSAQPRSSAMIKTMLGLADGDAAWSAARGARSRAAMRLVLVGFMVPYSR